MVAERFARDTSSGSRLGLVRDGDPPRPVERADPVAFGAEISLRLAATLNLRRTVGLVLTLAVPRLAPVARLDLDEGGALVGGILTEGELLRTWGSASAREQSGVTTSTGAAEAPVDPTRTELLPLRARGRVLGRLTLVRPAEAPPFDEDTRLLAGELAVRAALALDAARVYEERTTLASTLRDALRPAELPELPGVRLGARYRPAEEATEIGGDFYDVYRGPDQQWWFAVGDVCGKGVEAAVLTGKVRSALRMAALAGRRPDVVLGLLNEVMLLEGGTSFVTLLVGRIASDVDGAGQSAGRGRLHLSLAGGGHLEPLVLRRSGEVEAVPTGGVLVGMLPEAAFRTTEVTLEPDEVVVLYTDGVIEADDPTGEMFGPERLEALLADCRGMPPQAVAERIEQNVLEHLHGRPHDDIAVFALAPDPAPPAGRPRPPTTEARGIRR